MRWLGLSLACAAGMVLFLGISLTAAQLTQVTISPEAFWEQVDQTLAWLDSKPSETSEAWQEEAGRWERIREVAIPGQQTVLVDTKYILTLMRSKPPKKDELSAYLSALKGSRTLTTQAGGDDETKLLSEILARPEFQFESKELNFLEKFLQWISDQYARLMNRLFGDIGADIQIPSEITIPVTLVVITAILVFAFRDTLRNFFNEAELVDEAAGEGEILSARTASQKAQELSGSGDYRHALRYLYLSALLLLDERGLLRYNRAQTNREYLRQVRSRPDLSEHLQVVVDTFDRVWYGYQPIDEDDYAQYAGHVTALEETKE